LNKENNDLNRTIQSVIKYLSPLKKFGLVTFKTELNTLPLCDFDPEQIQHLLVHLITNSVDANKNATVTIRSFSDKQNNCVEVLDDGPGFPETIKQNPTAVFNLSNGGYGLFLCKSIIDKHNGEIKIKPSDKGALVHFSLPFNMQ
jgi:signal transduction histidine kinase